MLIDKTTFADVYAEARGLLLNAPIVSPRGKQTKELVPCVICLRDPRARLAYHSKRQFNLPFAIAEAVCMITGKNDVRLLSYFNPAVAQFSDNEVTFYGAYGPRIKEYLPLVVDKLRGDSDSRQAVINIYHSRDGLQSVTKDVPCTIALHFIIRDNKLDLIVYMRSNDLFWGLQYDVFCFTLIQEMIANELKVGLGRYFHVDTSLHVYDHHFSMLEEIESMESVPMPPNDLVASHFEALGELIGAMAYGQDERVVLILNDNYVLVGENMFFEALWSFWCHKRKTSDTDKKPSNLSLSVDTWAERFCWWLRIE